MKYHNYSDYYYNTTEMYNQTDTMESDSEVDDVMDGNQLTFYRVLQLIFAGIYAFLSFSFFWHCYVAVSMVKFIRNGNNIRTCHHFIYVLTLTVVDAVVLFHLPLLVIEIIETHWVLGVVWCKFFWVAESVNKILSTFILTALSFDRYLMVCHPRPTPGGILGYKTSLLIIILCVIGAFALLSPIYVNARVGDMGQPGHVFLKCVVDWSEDVEQIFTISLFIIGYCIPLTLMSYFYTRIVLQLRKRAQLFRSENTTSRMRTVTQRSFALVAFYFICWTPFWLMSLYISTQSEAKDFVVILFYLMHAMVYLNSAMNPVFYVLMNTEFKTHRGRIRSISAERCSRLRTILAGAEGSTNV